MDAIYYESHVTIDPCEDRDKVSELASKHGFKLAKLYMLKGKEVALDNMDMFMTAHSKHFNDLQHRMYDLIGALSASGLVLRRYKIEAVLVDSRQYKT
jgi:hypothetical protein